MRNNYFNISFQQGVFNLEIDYEFALGKCLGIYGASGSGKSTLLRCLAGLEDNLQGDFCFDGDIYLKENVRLIDAERSAITLCFQESKLFPHLNVQQNLYFAEKRALAKKTLTKHASYPEKTKIIEALNIPALLNKSVQELSGGEKKRVALVQALLSRPKLLLLDEPLSFLDQQSQTRFTILLEDLLANGNITIFYVSHDMQELCRLCEDLIILENGRVTYSGKAHNALIDKSSPLIYQNNPFVSLKVNFLQYNEAYGISEFQSEHGQLFYVLSQPNLAKTIHSKTIHLKIEANHVSLGIVKKEHAHEDQQVLSILNQLSGEIESILSENPHSLLLLVNCRGDKILSKISRLSYERMCLKLGSQVRVLVKAAAINEF